MKKVLSFMFIFLLSLSAYALADGGFCNDPDAIEQAAKSVLMLEVYDDDDELVATGSGFVAFNSNTLVTNYHVIEDAEWMLANSDDGYEYKITNIYVADEVKDIAICGFTSPTDMTPLEFGDTINLKRAESIVAIGSPIGITNTVSLGNISAFYEDEGVSWIQFTAPISSGSSGGVLFNDNGQVIGVTSASYDDTQNLNLAVNISEVSALYETWDGTEYDLRDYEKLGSSSSGTSKSSWFDDWLDDDEDNDTARDDDDVSCCDSELTLIFPDEGYLEWDYSDDDAISIRFEVENTSADKTVKSFEVYVYAEDKDGNDLCDGYVYYDTIYTTVKPGETVYSGDMEIPYDDDTYTLYCAIHEVHYTDGTTSAVNDDDLEFAAWDIG